MIFNDKNKMKITKCKNITKIQKIDRKTF